MTRRQRMRIRKRKQKERFARDYGIYDLGGRWFVVENRYNDYNHRDRGVEYWQTCYLSGPRKYAKSSTNSRIRSKYRFHPHAWSDDDELPTNSEYRKEYDYVWTVW